VRKRGFGSRALDKFLLARSMLAVFAFLGLVLPTTEVMNCMFKQENTAITRAVPILVASVCSSIEHVMSQHRKI
jgi:hypothetical protein